MDTRAAPHLWIGVWAMPMGRAARWRPDRARPQPEDQKAQKVRCQRSGSRVLRVRPRAQRRESRDARTGDPAKRTVVGGPSVSRACGHMLLDVLTCVVLAG